MTSQGPFTNVGGRQGKQTRNKRDQWSTFGGIFGKSATMQPLELAFMHDALT